MLITNIFLNQKKKIMILGIHYFITKLKTKIDVIPRSRFNLYRMFFSDCSVNSQPIFVKFCKDSV